ncbi:MAG: hypothetical protein QNJ32_21420 [Xenococcaceae cyanobacterium MO_167.B27]|nr:hypothetical protein [Xenococcaceae cyanobacterium MO_167.B27]
MDLLSMSHNLKREVAIKFFTSVDEISSQYFSRIFPKQDIFIFNPNQAFLQSLENNKAIIIKEVYKPHLRIPGEIYLSLWSVKLN